MCPLLVRTDVQEGVGEEEDIPSRFLPHHIGDGKSAGIFFKFFVVVSHRQA